MKRVLLFSGVAALIAATAVIAGPGAAFDRAERREIEAIVRDYLTENPDVVVEAIQRFQARREQAEAVERSRTLAEQAERLFGDPDDPIAGNPNGDVTVVEFFDYQCGYCKRVRDDLVKLIDRDRGVRVVLKEFPILGPISTAAARAALASRRQDRYWDYHNALMSHRGRLDEGKIFELARSIGLDVDRLRADMDDPEIGQAIEKTMDLAEALSVRGTPAFVVGDQVIPGAIGYEALRDLVAQARKAS